MANFYKEKNMDAKGYDTALNKQAIVVGGASKIALFGGDAGGAPLTVTSNNPGIIDLVEDGALNPNVRVFTLNGRRQGTTMVEAALRVARFGRSFRSR